MTQQDDNPYGYVTSPYAGEMDFGNYVAGRFAHQIGDPRAADFLLRAADQDPQSTIILSQAFLTLLTDGRFADAVAAAKRLHAQDSGNTLAVLYLALDALKFERYSQAQVYLEELSANGFEMLAVPITQAWVQAAQGHREAALQALSPLEAIPALRPFGATHRAFLLDYLCEDDAAQNAYLEALQGAQISSLQPVVSYAAFLQRLGRNDDAIAMLDEYLKAFRNNVFLLDARDRLVAGKPVTHLASTPAGAVSLVMFRAAGELGRDDAPRPAIIYARLASYLSPDMGDARLRLAAMLADADLYSAALSELRKIDEDAPEFDAAQLQTAWIHQQSDDYEEAITVLLDYLSIHPENVRGWAALGDIHRSNEAYEKAVEAYQRAINLHTADSDVQAWFLHFTRGIGYERMGDFDKAEADLLKALELNPDQPQVLNYLGYSWIDRGLHLERGTEMIERAVELRPNDGFIIDSLGWAYYLRGDYEEAVRHLERAVLLEPSDPTLNDHLGDAYWKVGQRKDARFQWTHALAADPDEEARQLIIDKLEVGLELALASQKDQMQANKHMGQQDVAKIEDGQLPKP
ncbi:hypothetical protein GCM10007972_00720 [Iodidimonas muriae]|uniref:Tetratricopeptide repeat protein n=2 Tax=Iodidimonas muriae TaxID=261467 RepID=A0ABQ2L5K7_9PROT|nr:hypothetical protein GCM10007972_00720 [Iodidimonas muriae]